MTGPTLHIRDIDPFNGYHRFRGDQGDDYGSFQVFYHDGGVRDEDGDEIREGWYWHACFPGCLPDGDPSGPFETGEDAFNDANKDS